MKRFTAGVALLGSILLGSQAAVMASPTVSVPDFKNKAGRLPWWSDQTSRQLADVLSNELSNVGVKVVERSNLNAVLSEQELSELGIVRKNPRNNNTAQKGQMRGAQFIILGGITAYDEGVETQSAGKNQEFMGFGGSTATAESKAYVALDLRIVNSTTGEIVGSRSIEGRATSTFQQKSKKRDFSKLTGFVKNNLGVSEQAGTFLDIAGTYKSEDSSVQTNKAPKAKAIRAALISAADYVNCTLVVRGSCLAEYERQEAERRSRALNLLQFD